MEQIYSNYVAHQHDGSDQEHRNYLELVQTRCSKKNEQVMLNICLGTLYVTFSEEGCYLHGALF